jgi:hypothetical protein
MARASLVPQVLDALVAGLRVYSTVEMAFRAPTGVASGVTVYDGPEWLAYDGPDPDGFVVVGYGGEDLDVRGSRTTARSGDDEGDPSVSGSQDVRAMATSSPKEQPQDDIECVAVYGSGAVDTAVSRTAAWRIVDAVDTFLRADPKLGIAASADGQVMWVQLTSRSMTQWLSSGSRCAIRFTLTAYTRT